MTARHGYKDDDQPCISEVVHGALTASDLYFSTVDP